MGAFLNWHYDWPNGAWLLLLMPLIIALFSLLYLYRQKLLRAFASKSLLNLLVEGRLAITFWIKVGLAAVAWSAAVVAMMQPKAAAKEEKSQSMTETAHRPINDVIFLLDVSASMAVKDGYGGKSREEIAKEIVDDVVRRLNGESVALYAFTSSTMEIVPLTMDYIFMRLMLRQVQINEGETAGTDIGQAVKEVLKNPVTASVTSPKTLVLLSDGGDTEIEFSKNESRKEELLRAVKDIADQRYQVMVVGLGSVPGGTIPELTFEGAEVHSSLEESLLKRIALVADGTLFFDQDTVPWQISQEIANQIKRRASRLPVQANMQGREERIKFQTPLGIALIALALFMLIPETHKRKKELQS